MQLIKLHRTIIYTEGKLWMSLTPYWNSVKIFPLQRHVRVYPCLQFLGKTRFCIECIMVSRWVVKQFSVKYLKSCRLHTCAFYILHQTTASVWQRAKYFTLHIHPDGFSFPPSLYHSLSLPFLFSLPLKLKVKVNFSLCLTKQHAMKVLFGLLLILVWFLCGRVYFDLFRFYLLSIIIFNFVCSWDTKVQRHNSFDTNTPSSESYRNDLRHEGVLWEWPPHQVEVSAQLHARGKSPQRPLDRSLVGPPIWPGLGGEEKRNPVAASVGNWNPVV
jgi:hypothetical protein